MLTLRYRRADATAAAASADLLGAAAFGSVTAAAIPAPLAPVQLPAFGLGPQAPGWLESWHSGDAGGLVAGRCGAVQYRHDAEVLFGSLCLDERDFGAAGDLASTVSCALQHATTSAYRQLFAALDQLGFPELWRVWNFIPHINEVEAGLERYRHFNIERQAEFLRSGRSTIGTVPVASAVGSRDGLLTIYFLAGRVPLQAIENPRQVSAYHYPAEYGPSSPIFARAGLVQLGGDDLLFISGTASIVGHRSLHVGDVAAQTRELTLNLDALLDSANQLATQRRFSPEQLVYKAYVRRAEDFPAVQRTLREWLGAAPVIYLQADICRSELLVEVEASGGHAIAMDEGEPLGDDSVALRAAP